MFKKSKKKKICLKKDYTSFSPNSNIFEETLAQVKKKTHINLKREFCCFLMRIIK